MSVACTSINDKSLSACLLGNKKETTVFNSILNEPDGTFFYQIPDETHIVTPAVLEDRINITTGRFQTVSLSATSETVWRRWSTPLFHMTQNNQCRQSPINIPKTVSFISLMIALSRRESLNPAHEQSSNTPGKRRERLADEPSSVTPKPPE